MECSNKLLKVRRKRLDAEDAAKLNVVDMALGFTAMMRLFEEGSKKKIRKQVVDLLPAIYDCKSESEFRTIHNGFCEWGIKNVRRAERKKNGKVVKPSGPPSYGQMAKTLDVILHVVIRYACYPDSKMAEVILKWLNTAMDTKMMAFLSSYYPDVLTHWPKTIEQVKTREQYDVIQNTVRQFIQEEHRGNITPIDFDDIYWRALNK